MCLLPKSKIELVQSSYVIIHEYDWYKHQPHDAQGVCKTLSARLYAIHALGSRSNLGLPYETIGIRVTKEVHGCYDGHTGRPGVGTR